MQDIDSSGKNVSILTSLVFEIPEQKVQGLNIGFIDGYVNLGNKSFREGNVPFDQLKQAVLAKPLPTTSAPNENDFFTAYQSLLQTSNTIVSIHQSNELASTNTNAKTVSESRNLPVSVFDSRFIGMAGGFIALEAAKIARQGAQVNEVLDIARKTHERVGFAVLAFPQLPMIESQRYPGLEYRKAGKTVLMSMDNGSMQVNDTYDSPQIAYRALFTWFKMKSRNSPSQIAISHDWRVDVTVTRGLQRLLRVSGLADEVTIGPESPHFTVHLGNSLRFSYLISE